MKSPKPVPMVPSHVVNSDLPTAYQEVAADEEREAEALEWAEATMV